MDICFSKEYGELNERIENGTSEVFELKTEQGVVRHMFIKRQLPFLVSGDKYYDLITPYGYGGPVIISAKNGAKKALCNAFAEGFSEYCKQQRIISEFVRFHPIAKNAEDFQELYQPIYMRKTLGTDLASFENPIQAELSKSCQKNFRRALNRGVSFRITESPAQIDSFYDIYYSTMKRDGASSFYYFDRGYFDSLIRLFQNRLLYIEAIYENRVIAAGIYFLSDDVIYVHLSGTLSEYLHLSPAYVLRYAVIQWGKEHGYKLVFHGGGTSNSEDNSLYLFKKQFACHTEIPFYVGKKIWNSEIYRFACNISECGSTDYFPAYRKLR